jgi:hypothetical protein
VTVRGGVIQSLSVSQIEKFDPAQTGGCPRRWWFEAVQGFRPERTEALSDGDKGHALLADYLRTGQPPEGRVKMGTAVRAAIAAGNLPPPGDHLLVERRFSGQPQRNAAGNWVPLDTAKTLWLGGVPWDGFVDCQWYEAETRRASVLDHKFSSDIRKYAKPAERLLLTVQMPVYCANALRVWPASQEFELVHHYVARTGQDSFLRRAVVALDQVLDRCEQVETLVEKMKVVARVERQDEVEFNRRSCDAYNGCPHQSRCRAFKEKQVMLTPEEQALFGALELPTDTPPAKPAPVVQPPPPPPRRVMVDVGPNESEEDAIARSRGLTPPVASKPAPQPPPEEKPACPACGVALVHDQNASRLASGTLKHVGCPGENPESVPAKRGPGRPPGAKNKAKEPVTTVEPGKREDPPDDALRDQARSFEEHPPAVVATPSTPSVPPGPTTAAVAVHPLSLTVNVVVELGPTITAILRQLLGARS